MSWRRFLASLYYLRLKNEPPESMK